MHVFSQNIPTRVFAGRLLSLGQWHRVEIESADALQCVMNHGTAYGLGCRVRLPNRPAGEQFSVMVDDLELPQGDPEELDQVKQWLPKCALVLAIAVLAKNQPIPETGIFRVAATDYSKDPQRDDARAFRQRCRFDVLHVAISSLNANPPAKLCKYSTLAVADTHTRIYCGDDFVDAIQYWQRRGLVSLLNRGGDIRMDQTLDDEMMAELSKYTWDEAAPASVEGAVTDRASGASETDYDLFVSHASEDKAAVVVPLTDELVRRGLRVWVDFRELRIGDKLRERIDEGLRRSRFGLVIVSPRFFAKQWPQAELDGLVALELTDGRKRILPVWHDVEYADVAQQSPTLAARLATKWSEGITKVVEEIVRAVQD
jgi:hypothetical protein